MVRRISTIIPVEVQCGWTDVFLRPHHRTVTPCWWVCATATACLLARTSRELAQVLRLDQSTSLRAERIRATFVSAVTRVLRGWWCKLPGCAGRARSRWRRVGYTLIFDAIQRVLCPRHTPLQRCAIWGQHGFVVADQSLDICLVSAIVRHLVATVAGHEAITLPRTMP
jgi:hypothetical protein